MDRSTSLKELGEEELDVVSAGSVAFFSGLPFGNLQSANNNIVQVNTVVQIGFAFGGDGAFATVAQFAHQSNILL
jgi:hypothetical protein